MLELPQRGPVLTMSQLLTTPATLPTIDEAAQLRQAEKEERRKRRAEKKKAMRAEMMECWEKMLAVDLNDVQKGLTTIAHSSDEVEPEAEKEKETAKEKGEDEPATVAKGLLITLAEKTRHFGILSSMLYRLIEMLGDEEEEEEDEEEKEKEKTDKAEGSEGLFSSTIPQTHSSTTAISTPTPPNRTTPTRKETGTRGGPVKPITPPSNTSTAFSSYSP